MKIYTVHRRAWSASEDADAVFVKEGFCWPAFFFGFLWTLWRGMWVASAALFGLSIAIGLIGELAGMNEAMTTILQIALHAGAGIFGNDMLRWSLRRAGWLESAVVTAPRRIDAEYRYFAAVAGGVTKHQVLST